MAARAIVGMALWALAGCGTIYTAPRVHDGAPLGQAYGTEYDVRVVPLTYRTAAAANLEPYVPARLPLAFQPEALELADPGTTVQPRLPALPRPSARRLGRPGPVADSLPPPVEPGRYRIGVGDVLLLSVSGPTTLEGLPALIGAQSKREGYVVQDDGTIAIPDAGRARVAGLTLRDAETEIAETLIGANIDPSFALEIAEFNSQRVSIGGLVGQPSLVPIGLQPLHLDEAIDLAGGIAADDADATVIQLFRDGRPYRIGLDRYLSDPQARRILLQDGDSIHVGSLYRESEAERFFGEQLQLRGEVMNTVDFQLRLEELRTQREMNAEQRLANERALFRDRLEFGAVERHYAFRTGEVARPGLVALPFEGSLSLGQVLFADDAGGIQIERGDYGEIYVLRTESDPRKAGGLTAYHLDAENAANLAVAGQFEMRPNDVVFVAEQRVTSWNRVISQILPQLLLSLPGRVASFGAGGA